jgi:hypothetical protein
MRRGWLRLLSGLLLAYGAACAWLYFGQRGLVYFGQYTRVDAATTDFELRRGDCILRGWADRPEAAQALLYFGGNAERIEGMRDRLRERFPAHALFLLAYRGYGASDCEASEAALIDDALALFDRAAAGGRPVDAIGRSLGSGVAMQLAARRPVRRLVLVTPFDSLAEVGQAHYPLFPVRWLATERYDSVAAAPRVTADVTVLIAGRDEIIPRANTEALIAAFAARPKAVEFPAAGHNDIALQPGYAEALGGRLTGGSLPP